MAMHGEHMEAQPLMGVRVTQVRGAGNHIRFEVRYGTEKRGCSPHIGAWGCMEIQKERSLAGAPGLLGISPPPLPPPPPPPIPAGGLEYRRVFANSKRQLAWPRVHCKI